MRQIIMTEKSENRNRHRWLVSCKLVVENYIDRWRKDNDFHERLGYLPQEMLRWRPGKQIDNILQEILLGETPKELSVIEEKFAMSHKIRQWVSLSGGETLETQLMRRSFHSAMFLCCCWTRPSNDIDATLTLLEKDHKWDWRLHIKAFISRWEPRHGRGVSCTSSRYIWADLENIAQSCVKASHRRYVEESGLVKFWNLKTAGTGYREKKIRDETKDRRKALRVRTSIKKLDKHRSVRAPKGSKSHTITCNEDLKETVDMTQVPHRKKQS